MGTVLLIITVASVVLLAVALIAALIAFGAAAPPKVTDAMKAPFARIDDRDLPALETFPARDGTALAYRRYPAGGDDVTVLIHGSVGASESMHMLAKALQASGAHVYALDMRGRGGSGPNGDIAYIGQLDDDLSDLTRLLRSRHPDARLMLAGYSSGGGYVLRIAGGPMGSLFDRYRLISPYLGHRAPTQKPNGGGWTVPYLPRLIGLSILDRMGLHAFEGLPVVALAPVTGGETAPTSSYRLARNFHPNAHFLDDVRRTQKPVAVVVGAEDEVLYADRFAPMIGAIRSDISITVLSGLDHTGVITDREGVHAVAAALR